MKKPVLVGILIVLALGGLILYSTLSLGGYRVEVCMGFNGQTNCRTATGSSEEFALRTATANACAAIASGVTDSMACERSAPVKTTWLKK
jgi:hypothetical protein